MAVHGKYDFNFLDRYSTSEDDFELTSVEQQTPYESDVRAMEQLDPKIIKIWDHFHSAPVLAKKSTWKRFFTEQKSLERSLLLVTAVPDHTLQSQSDNLLQEKIKTLKLPPDYKKPCPVKGCEKSYRSLGHLKEHIQQKHPEQTDLLRTHFTDRTPKDESNFPCPITECRSGFFANYTLQEHIKHKHRT